VVISAGFAEIGEEGKEREQQLLKLAEEKDLNILGPNCLGFILPEINLNASFAGGMPQAGNIAFVTSPALWRWRLWILPKKNRWVFRTLFPLATKCNWMNRR